MTSPVRLKHWAALSALALAASTAFAADLSARSRSDVDAETLAARAAGTLTPAGEGIDTRGPAVDSRSTLTRSAVMADVLAARAAGQLMAAGEGTLPSALPTATATGPLLARASVKADVLAARASGQLVPAGEGMAPDALQRSRAAAAWMAQARRQRANTLDTARAPQANNVPSAQ